MNAEKLMNADKIFKNHGDRVRRDLADAAKVKHEAITDDQVKAQIAKGWLLTGKDVICLGCARKIAKNTEDLGKMKKLVCKVCPMKWAL